jgi:hypothetical protein
MTWSASANARSTSPADCSIWAMLFVPSDSSRSGAPGSSAFSGSTTAGSGSHSTSTRSRPSSARYGVVATTTATGSPTWRTVSVASGLRLAVSTSSRIGPVATRSPMSSLRSAPVNTATTPSSASAADVSIAVTRAWACGLRTKEAWSIPGSAMSSR